MPSGLRRSAGKRWRRTFGGRASAKPSSGSCCARGWGRGAKRMEVYYWPDYERRARRLFTEDERKAAELEIVGAPLRWPVIPRTGGARKARVAKGSKGKSGGTQNMYYVMDRGSANVLVYWISKW